MNSHYPTPLKPTVANLSQSIFTVNRHAKTATNPKYLYKLKKAAIEKMLFEGKAIKVGLHFSENPKYSQQQSDVLVQCGEYSFHIPPSKQDFQALPHLGKLDHSSKNPKCRMPLNQAKHLLEIYTGIQEIQQASRPHYRNPKVTKPIFKKLGDSY
ncbi:YkyB family protein [Heyndrickxia sp. NPDC080065]|uniref:YkyB family protein n=1 Tax=Heyndrickxia sp. NPDC080065 TaxID=3390568 RepID=UPI003CFFB3AC